MVERLLKLSLKHRWIVLAAAAALLVVGLHRSANMPIDVFPDLTAPRVTVVTESTGMAAEEVERLITFPIETAVNGTAGLRRVRSASAPGISVVWAEFDWDTSPTIARQRVTERLQSITSALPPEAGAPQLAPAASVMGEIAFVALTSDTVSSMDLRRAADVDVRRRLLGVRGVSQAVPIGGDVKQYQILVDPYRIEPLHITLAAVVEAVQRGSCNAPGGYVVDGGQESVVRVLGRAHGVADLEAIVVATRGATAVRVRDIATVREGPAVARGTASYNAHPAVLISVVKQPEADTVSTTRRLDVALDDLAQDLNAKGIELHRDIFRQQDFIDTAIDNVLAVLRDGAMLVIIVLFLFLWSLRPTLISAVAIPLSLLSAVLVLDLFGLSIDTMTLGGLTIAIGELVDDAIVDVENVARRLRERSKLPEDEQPTVIATVLRASLEIRSAIVSATYILMLVFVPLLLLEGLEGRLLRPLAISYLAAIGASLVVAITVTPVLCSFLLPRAHNTQAQSEPALMRWISAAYAPMLRAALRRPFAVLALVAVMLTFGVGAFTGLGRSFLPEFNEGSLTINMVLAPGTSLTESNALATMAERALLDDPAVLSVGRRTGRAERDEHVLGVETTEIEVRVSREDVRTREQLFADIRERLTIVPAQFTLGQPISHRIEHMMSGQRSALSVKVFGDNLRELRRVAERAKAAMEPIPGIVDLGVEQIVDIPQIVVRIDAQTASAYGMSAGAAAQAVGTALWGATATHIYEQGTATEVVVRYPSTLATSMEAVARIRIPTPSGALVPVSALAEVRRDSGPNYVLRENVSRRLVVTANVSGGDVRGTYEQVRRAIADQVPLPDGVHIEYAGQFEREEAAGQRLFLFGSLAVLGIAFIVATTLSSVRRALIVLINLPLALAGGMAGVHLAGGVLSVATTIGFITLFGIATRNGILLATRTRDLELEGQEKLAAISLAARERLAPILMTAVTAALGLLPLALALGEPGSEIQAPMALVILTGLTTSTLLNMIVVPSLLARWGGNTAPPVS
ncbi:MAG: efflux RND transporter permease subunit [Nannocystaceae bacterium]